MGKLIRIYYFKARIGYRFSTKLMELEIVDDRGNSLEEFVCLLDR